MLSIKTNLSNLKAQSNLKLSNTKLNQAVERLSSGYKLNHASDNAANYSISTNMSTQIGGLKVAEENVSMGLDLLSTATDTLATMQDKAVRLRALSTQARNGTYGSQSLSAMNTEANALVAEIMRAYNNAEYNGIKLLNRAPVNTQESGTRAVASGFIDESFAKVDTSTMKTLSKAVTDGETIKGGTWAIGSVEDLVKLAELTDTNSYDTKGTTFVLSDDIDLEQYCKDNAATGGWTPIGRNASGFGGTFNGNGHKISNLTINRPDNDFQGLFGVLNSADSVIENVGLENANVTGQGSVGALVGNSFDTVTITNCYATGSVTGSSNQVGGLIGISDSLTATNCYATGNVTGQDWVGALVGGVSNGTLTATNCYATGNVTGRDSVGGLVGAAMGLTATNCYATGDVTGEVGVGGLVGVALVLTATNSYATGDVTGDIGVGGFAGMITDMMDAPIDNCYSLGKVSGNDLTGSFIGGIMAGNGGTITITNCSALASGTMIGGACDGSMNPIDYDMTDWLSGITPITSAGGNNSSPVGMVLQVGIHGKESDEITANLGFNFDFGSLTGGIEKASTLEAIQEFEKMLSEKQTELGSVQNRLESVLEEIGVKYDNLISSRSTIRDADVAELSSTYIRQQILQNAGATLMSACQNVNADMVLGLLQGLK